MSDHWADKTRLQDYSVVEEIASGGAGVIVRARCRVNGQQVVRDFFSTFSNAKKPRQNRIE